jgi:hypothetical protein
MLEAVVDHLMVQQEEVEVLEEMVAEAQDQILQEQMQLLEQLIQVVVVAVIFQALVAQQAVQA